MVLFPTEVDNQRVSTTQVSIDSLMELILDRFKPQIHSKNLSVEKELDSFQAEIAADSIDSAMSQLIENAIKNAPVGGEINVTLVDSKSYWELEIAGAELDANPSKKQPDSHPARFEPIKPLEVAKKAASLHGGEVQTWRCPLGETAQILIIPRNNVPAPNEPKSN